VGQTILRKNSIKKKKKKSSEKGKNNKRSVAEKRIMSYSIRELCPKKRENNRAVKWGGSSGKGWAKAGAIGGRGGGEGPFAKGRGALGEGHSWTKKNYKKRANLLRAPRANKERGRRTSGEALAQRTTPTARARGGKEIPIYFIKLATSQTLEDYGRSGRGIEDKACSAFMSLLGGNCCYQEERASTLLFLPSLVVWRGRHVGSDGYQTRLDMVR